MKEQIRKLLYALWGGTILDFNYDLLSHQLRLNVRIRGNEEVTFYRIGIDEISSITFHDTYTDGLISPSNTEIGYVFAMMELTEFEYYPEFEDQIDFPSKDGSTVSPKGGYNLVLEIWDAEIFILARRLKINDQEFKLL